MGLSARILLPIALILAAGVAAGLYYRARMDDEETALRREVAAVLRTNSVARRLQAVEHQARLDVFLDRPDPDRTAEVDALLAELHEVVTTRRARRYVASFEAGRDAALHARRELHQAFRRGDDTGAATRRWVLQEEAQDAHLANLVGFKARRLRSTLANAHDRRLALSDTLLTSLGLVVLAVGVVAFLVARAAIRPVRALTATAERVADGDYTIRAADDIAVPELRALAQAFNAMTDGLVAANAHLERKVRERTAALEDEAARRRDREAEAHARSKDLETLLYVTSHDLREPLRAIRNFSQIVNDRYAADLDERARDYLARVCRAAERMDRLIRDILELSRAQRMAAPAEPVPARALVDDVLRRLETTIEESGASVDVADDLPVLVADRTWAGAAIYNYVANALKYDGGRPPEVEIAAYEPAADEPGDVGLAVRDRGPGVPPDHAERIFRLFQRAVSRNVAGTGAGLAIVKGIAERHGGDAWMRPRPGGGSEFIITFGGRAAALEETAHA